MINLLPPDSKRQLRAARRNVALRRYAIFVGCVAVSVFATFGFGYYLTVQERSRLEAEMAGRSGQMKQYANVRSAAAQFSKDLATAKIILANEVVFSDLIRDISRTRPAGVVLSELDLSTESFGTEISIKARAKDADTGPISLKTALEASPIFSNVKIVSINERVTAKASSLKPMEAAYPVSFELMATIDAAAGKRTAEGATP